MQSQTQSPSDMPEEVIQLLNDADKGIVGITRPKVQHGSDKGMSYLERAQYEPEEDHMRLDEQGME